MHSLYFVMFDKERAPSAGIAGGVADTILIDEGFCNQGFFGSGKSDRYEIGGRRKGFFERLFDPSITIIPDDAVPAMLITDALRLKLSDETRADAEIFDADDFSEISISELTSKHNDKWLVIIDYHS